MQTNYFIKVSGKLIKTVFPKYFSFNFDGSVLTMLVAQTTSIVLVLRYTRTHDDGKCRIKKY